MFLAEQLGKHTQKVQRGVPDDLLIKRQETEEDLKRARLEKQRELKALLDDQVQYELNNLHFNSRGAEKSPISFKWLMTV